MLDLSWNHIRLRGAVAFGKALHVSDEANRDSILIPWILLFYTQQAHSRKPGLQQYMVLYATNHDLLLANNKGADQPAHPRSLISAFVIHYQKVKSFLRASTKKSLTTPLTESRLYLIHHIIFWYLSHCRATKANVQTRQSLRCSYTQSMDVDVESDQNLDL